MVSIWMDFMSTQLDGGGFFGGCARTYVMEHSQREKILEKYGQAPDPENVYVLTELVGDELRDHRSLRGDRFRRTDSAMRRCARRS